MMMVSKLSVIDLVDGEVARLYERTGRRDIQGDGVSCQANIMASAAVWPAMLEAFAGAEGPLVRRLLTTLLAWMVR